MAKDNFDRQLDKAVKAFRKDVEKSMMRTAEELRETLSENIIKDNPDDPRAGDLSDSIEVSDLKKGEIEIGLRKGRDRDRYAELVEFGDQDTAPKGTFSKTFARFRPRAEL